MGCRLRALLRLFRVVSDLLLSTSENGADRLILTGLSTCWNFVSVLLQLSCGFGQSCVTLDKLVWLWINLCSFGQTRVPLDKLL